MALYINKELNTLVFNEEEFELHRNYIPDLFLGLRELNPNKEINIAIDMEKTPIVFVLFFKKIIEESPGDITIFFKEDTDILRKSLINYGLKYRNIEDFPWELP